jgi:hypothetical protein
MKTTSLFPIGALLIFVGYTFAAPPITPTQVISLFNGKDLSPFDVWVVDSGHADPDHVFSVVEQIDGASAIRVSGQHYGAVITKDSFTNYRLIVEFRWGLLTWSPRRNSARDSGILLHGQGRFGNTADDFNGPWMRSVEYQLIEGGSGDLILVGGFDAQGGPRISPSMTCTPEPKIEGKAQRWKPGAPSVQFPSGRMNWYGHDLDWKDVTGYRGSQELERPWGEWNRVEIICDGDRVVYWLNGTKVNEASGLSVREGKLLFQSEGAELFFRKIELHPLIR